MKHLLKKHRMLSVGIFLAAVLSIIYAAILSPAGKSTGSFSEFCTTLFREEMKSNTMNLHFTLKDPKAAGIDSYEITLGSLSGDSPHNQARQLKKLSEELKKYSHRSLKGKDRLTCRLLSDYISRQQNLAAYPYYDEPLTPSGGVTSQLPVLLAEYTFRNTRDIKDYLGLLSQMDTYFLGILDYEQKKADAGLFMSDEACLKVIEGCEVFTEHPDDNFLIDTFSNRLNAMDGLTDTQKNAYLKQHSKVLSDHVIPAYSQMIKGLTLLLGRGHNNWGLCNFPEGKAYYEAVVSADTGCDDSVEDLFSQIAKARREDLTFCQNLLEKNPKLASQSPKPDAALKEENAMLSRLQKEILTDFPAPPQTEVEICHVDPALSEYLAPAFYITAPIDDISHNRIYINDAKNDTDIYYFTTLAHEGYPGHLYQTICTSSYGTPKVLSLLNYPGYTEGWATYTEMQSFYYAGLDPDLASLLQHNQAATLSLYATADIGIHYFGWEKEKNAAFWSEYGVDDTATVKRITDLILEEPGNYLKYYVGYLKFRQMREQLALENKNFSVSAFHEAILRTGPSPFSVLEETVRDQLK
ncbi:DUF885 domain-containing protein [Roseburia faecis]|uniref:DUF885 domain-containing protein n=1 Tax=Roseburia faecis TaxID=301302 RepID=UPI001D077F16|nr:DUF885 domain-containing protein [Roseburia faecis]MCB6947538.1 DUF885 domain-containing protein [Roseburia faecis]